jgi:methyl-accepting chemotaxis protein
MSDGRYKRRNYIIKSGFQLRYTLSIVVLLIAVMLATGAGMYLGMWGSIIANFNKFKVSEGLETAKRISDYEEARYRKGDYRLEKIFREAELLSAQQRHALEQALRAVNKSLLPKALALAAVIFIAGIFISHRIAGPLYRIERSAEAIRKGDLTVNFHVRKDDDIKDTAHILDEMVDALQADVMRIKAASLELEEKIKSITGCLSEPDARLIRGLIDEIYAVSAKYKI